MTSRRLTASEVKAFAEQFDAFGAGLSPAEQDFLRAILGDAAAALDAGSFVDGRLDDRTIGEIALAIHRACRTPPISLNPQPIPVSLPSTSPDAT